MKRILFCVVLLWTYASPAAREHIVIGWNDLGMHCSNKYFGTLVVLPPFNNIRAQVIHVGDALNLPQVVTTDLRVSYEIPGNTFSAGKTDFWDYENLIFGVDLPPDIGLTGNGLSGDMGAETDHFSITGVPITPFQDADLVHEDPFQLGLLTLYDHAGQPLATTESVVPVSNEINCVSAGCHASEQEILNEHDAEGGFDPANKPILCASCHSSNALGTPGHSGVPSLSEAIHKQHGGITNDCYKCHPGPNTQCLRDVMKTEHGFTCQTCHGSVTEVGESISDGRIPWLEEPQCGSEACHGAQYAEEPGKLFRESRGHGGLFCSACHGEPHAIVPSGQPRDNLQNIALQGYAGTLNKCSVCHGVTPSGAGPHGLLANCCIGARGNVDNVGEVNVADLTFLVAFLFKGGATPVCMQEADVDASGSVIVSDLTYLVNFLFKGGLAPVTCPA